MDRMEPVMHCCLSTILRPISALKCFPARLKCHFISCNSALNECGVKACFFWRQYLTPLTVGVYTCSVSARLKLRCQTGPQGVGLQEQERERKTFKLPHAILYSSGDRHGGLCFDKGTMSYVWMLIKIHSELPNIFFCLGTLVCTSHYRMLAFRTLFAVCILPSLLCKTRPFRQQITQLDMIQWREEKLP